MWGGCSTGSSGQGAPVPCSCRALLGAKLGDQIPHGWQHTLRQKQQPQEAGGSSEALLGGPRQFCHAFFHCPDTPEAGVRSCCLAERVDCFGEKGVVVGCWFRV